MKHPDYFRPEPPRYYRGRLWKITRRISRVGSRAWRYIKFYERRAAVGLPWVIVHHAVYNTRRPI